MVHKGTSSSYRSVDCIGLWSCLMLLSYLPSASVSSVFMCYSCIYYVLLRLHLSLYFLVSWAWWDWPLMWLTNHRPSVLWHCWLGHLSRKIVSEMTYNVSSGTALNPTIPYHTSDVLRVRTPFSWPSPPRGDIRLEYVSSTAGMGEVIKFWNGFSAVVILRHSTDLWQPSVTVSVSDSNEAVKLSAKFWID